MDIKEIQNLIRFVAKSGASEVKLETEDFKITIKTGSDEEAVRTQIVAPAALPQMPVQAQAAPQPSAPAPAAPAASGDAPSEENSNLITIKSPMIGTFYRRPSPDKDPFTQVGAEIKTGDVVCVIEAMKLFNEIESEITGKIVKVLVEDQSPVEYDQPLFLVDPS